MVVTTLPLQQQQLQLHHLDKGIDRKERHIEDSEVVKEKDNFNVVFYNNNSLI